MATRTMTESSSRDTKVVRTTLNYYLDPSKGGHTTYQIGVSDYYRRKFEPHNVEIHDIRGKEDQFHLNTNGFQHEKHTSVEKDFDDDERVRQVVYPETEELIRNMTGATKVHTFSHIIRRDNPTEVLAAVNSDPTLQSGDAPYQKVIPARFIHVDFSNEGADEILRDNLDHSLVETLIKTRWAIINVWRPIKPISKDPLALCDARTVREQDLMPVRSELPPKGSGQYAAVSGGTGFELYYKRYQPEEKWYFCDRMMPDEILMIKCFDSRNNGKTARSCPHSAFSNPATDSDPTRESIEVRSLVFFEDQPN